MTFGAVGDIHGDFEALDRVMAAHPEVAFWLCPGDLADENGEYPRPRAPLYWIKGNNEDFDFVAAQTAGSGTIPNLVLHSQWNFRAGGRADDCRAGWYLRADVVRQAGLGAPAADRAR